jgi:hypothetical protein
VGGAWLPSQDDFLGGGKRVGLAYTGIGDQPDDNRAVRANLDVIRARLLCRTNGSGNVSLGETGGAAWH